MTLCAMRRWAESKHGRGHCIRTRRWLPRRRRAAHCAERRAVADVGVWLNTSRQEHVVATTKHVALCRAWHSRRSAITASPRAKPARSVHWEATIHKYLYDQFVAPTTPANARARKLQLCQQVHRSCCEHTTLIRLQMNPTNRPRCNNKHNRLAPRTVARHCQHYCRTGPSEVQRLDLPKTWEDRAISVWWHTTLCHIARPSK